MGLDTARSSSRPTSAIAYDTNGDSVRIERKHTTEFRDHAIRPATIDFGVDPEAVRSGARRRSSATVSTHGEEHTMQTENCDPITAIIPCDDPPVGGPIPTGPGVDLGTACNVWNFTVVTSETDWDQDGIKDACEAELATAFEPKLVLHTQEMYSGREPYWTVQRVGPQVYVGYLFAYYYDAAPWEHHGDSEWVIVTLRQDSLYRWALDFVKLSAHWGSSLGDETRWVGAPDLLYIGSVPVVFVSKVHHGNYESEQRCDARIGDECSPFGIQVAPLGIV